MRKTFIALALVTVVAIVAGPATAGGRGHGGGGGGGHGGGGHQSGATGTISPAWAGDAHYNQVIRFNVSTTATPEPWVNLKCYQSGTLVAQGWEGYFDRSLDDGNFGLNSSMWTGGEADCTAYLTTPQRAVISSTSFHVYG